MFGTTLNHESLSSPKLTKKFRPGTKIQAVYVRFGSKADALQEGGQTASGTRPEPGKQ
jgi:hypothetical protein